MSKAAQLQHQHSEIHCHFVSLTGSEALTSAALLRPPPQHLLSPCTAPLQPFTLSPARCSQIPSFPSAPLRSIIVPQPCCRQLCTSSVPGITRAVTDSSTAHPHVRCGCPCQPPGWLPPAPLPPLAGCLCPRRGRIPGGLSSPVASQALVCLTRHLPQRSTFRLGNLTLAPTSVDCTGQKLRQ